MNGVLKQLEEPSGRNPEARRLKLSDWFNSLDESTAERVKDVIEESVDAAVFGFLCVLDGVRAISNEPDVSLKLMVVTPSEDPHLLNDPNNEELHDLYKQATL